MRNTEKEADVYEIENIIKHKVENNKYIFLVKWQGYESKDDSWVKEKDFTKRDTIKDYFCKNTFVYK